MQKPQSLTLPAIPTPLYWDAKPTAWDMNANGDLTISAGPQTDLFISPLGDTRTLNSPRLLFAVQGDYQISASVAVDFNATFDAGVLILYGGEDTWAKLCFEYSPQHQPMVVSVVTQTYSDDANAFRVDSNQVYLRIAHIGRAYAFHASTDGRYWQFVRHFTLNAPNIAVGFSSQAPTGAGCSASFSNIRYVEQRLNDIRSGE